MDVSALKARLGRVWTYRWSVDVGGRRYDTRLESGWRANTFVVASEGTELARETLDFYAEPFRLQELRVDDAAGGALTFRTAPRTFYSYGFDVLRDAESLHRSHANPFGALGAIEKISNFGNSEEGRRQAERSKEAYPAIATDILVSVLLYFAAGFMSLRGVAMLGAGVMLTLMAVDWASDRLLSRKLRLTGGLSGLGVLMLALSAAFAWAVDSDLAIQLKSSVLGLVAAVLLAIDAAFGGKYIGARTAQYVTFIDIDPRRFSWGSALAAGAQSLLSGAVAIWLSRDTWLLYKHWIGPVLGLALGALVLWKARRPRTLEPGAPQAGNPA